MEVDIDTSSVTVYMGLLARDHLISASVVTLNPVIRPMCALTSTLFVPSGSKFDFIISLSQKEQFLEIRDTVRPSTNRGCQITVQRHVANVPNRLIRARMSMMYHVQDGNFKANVTLTPSRNCIICSKKKTLLV